MLSLAMILMTYVVRRVYYHLVLFLLLRIHRQLRLHPRDGLTECLADLGFNRLAQVLHSLLVHDVLVQLDEAGQLVLAE